MPHPGPSIDIIKRFVVSLDDEQTSNILQHLDGATRWIADALTTPLNVNGTKTEPQVLVHCVRGVSRSVTIVIAYLMRHVFHEYPEPLQTARDIVVPREASPCQTLVSSPS